MCFLYISFYLFFFFFLFQAEDGIRDHCVTGVQTCALPILVVTVESPPTSVGCPLCGVIASSHGRRLVWLVDAPSFGRPVRIVWRKRTWRCREPACPSRSFTEQDERISRAGGLLTLRAG